MNPATFSVFLLALCVCCTSSQETLKVKTESGWVQGLYGKTRAGKQIRKFLGIPYAKSATGSLRFKSPEKPEPWNDVLNATVECSECIQQNVYAESLRKTVSGSENCLCVNVFCPDATSKNPTKLPVIVFIHGSGNVLSSSTSALYGPELLLEKDVVLVTFNYRLGVMGFLTTGDCVIPGNFGMKDQALALKWVKENIAHFGGDPDSITLFGESTGAVSVNLHEYSPLSQGLFHKRIQDSESVFSSLAMQTVEELKGRSAVVVDKVGCSMSTSSAALLECLQGVSAEAIVNTTHTFLLWDLDPIILWAPVVETCKSKKAFLTEDPRTSKKSLTKPLLTGFNYADGALKTTSVTFGNVSQKFSQWNEQFYSLTPISLYYNGTHLDCTKVTKKIRKFYFGSEDNAITSDMVIPITELYGDRWFIMGVLDAAERNKGPTYLFYYNYNKNSSVCPVVLGTSPPLIFGACHLDELMSLFPMAGLAPKYDPTNKDPDYLLSVKMVEMWTNFAKSSNPSTSDITWKPVKSKALEHLEITNNGIAMRTNPVQKRRQFWKTLEPIYQRHNVEAREV